MKFNDAFEAIVEEKNAAAVEELVTIGNICHFFITWLFNFRDVFAVIIVESTSKITPVESNIVE